MPSFFENVTKSSLGGINCISSCCSIWVVRWIVGQFWQLLAICRLGCIHPWGELASTWTCYSETWDGEQYAQWLQIVRLPNWHESESNGLGNLANCRIFLVVRSGCRSGYSQSTTVALILCSCSDIVQLLWYPTIAMILYAYNGILQLLLFWRRLID